MYKQTTLTNSAFKRICSKNVRIIFTFLYKSELLDNLHERLITTFLNR